MPRTTADGARGKSRTRKVKSVGGRAVPRQTLRRSPPDFPESLDALGRLTRQDLRDLARREGLRGRSRLKRKELVLALWTLVNRPSPQTAAPAHPSPADWESAPLPKAYGRDRLVLMPIDPYWVHAYWEIGPHLASDPASGGEKGTEGARRILRVYDVTFIDFDGANAHSAFDIEITPEAQNWYINLWSPGKSLCAELGLVHRDGTFSPRVRSNRIQTPPAWTSLNTEERWIRTDREAAGHSPVQVPVSSASAEILLHPGSRELSGPTGVEAVGPSHRPPERIRAEEYRRFLKEAERRMILGKVDEASRGSGAGLSSGDLLKER